MTKKTTTKTKKTTKTTTSTKTTKTEPCCKNCEHWDDTELGGGYRACLGIPFTNEEEESSTQKWAKVILLADEDDPRFKDYGRTADASKGAQESHSLATQPDFCCRKHQP